MASDFLNIKEFLDEKADQYNNERFIDTDPVSVPHRFSSAGDIEISAFFTATIAWGQRATIMKNGLQLMKLMDYSPEDFVRNSTENDRKILDNFGHRTFNGDDARYFTRALQLIYRSHGGLKQQFTIGINNDGVCKAIGNFKKLFFSLDHKVRTRKHIADPVAGSTAKRINMFLRWMIRRDDRGVDFGIWEGISPALLHCPLDVHSGRVARKLGLLERKQNDWKAVEELTFKLREFDKADPVKYDYALFGLGIFEKF